MTFFDSLNAYKFDFTSNLSGIQIVTFPHCAALTSHFDSFWSTVIWLKHFRIWYIATVFWFQNYVADDTISELESFAHKTIIKSLEIKARY